ncbi:SH3 domain-containing protein 19 [Aulostomus maculatus]
MAEAVREGEEEGDRRDLRDVRNRNQATDHLERTKPDHLHSSQGPLSSLRAAIKRTRTNSQSDHTRDRRRPEITIIAAEPLDSNNWFSGTSVAFPSPPPSGWSAGIQVVSPPPPSYDQVIKEKTEEEHIVQPTAAPRRSTCTTTSATQTDPVREDAAATAPQGGAAPQSVKQRSAGEKPQKPPRPSLPKPVDREPAAKPGGTSEGTFVINETASRNTEDQCDLRKEFKKADQEGTPRDICTRSVTVHWDTPAEHLPSVAAAPTEHKQTPVPRPRIKTRKQSVTEGATYQTLVKVSDDCGKVTVTTGADPDDVAENKYLKELLEVFCAENKCEENSDNQSHQGEDADDEMSTSHSQRNIQARIQAFESQASAEDGNVSEAVKPQPLPRKSNKPPVASKPSVDLRPQFDHSIDSDSQNVSTANIPPTPAPKPQTPKKPVGAPVKQELETLFSKGTVPPRSRPSVLTRAYSIHEEETPEVPPSLPVRPFKEPLKPNLNINNHNSTSPAFGGIYVEGPLNHKPQSSVDSSEGSFKRQSVKRPTTIRVPSKPGSLSETFQDSPPPLPAQKPVGALNTSIDHKQNPTPILPSQESFTFGPEPSLPPRRLSTSKTLPPRPPPAKPGPGRPPPPSLQVTGRSHSVPLDTSPKPQTQKPHRKGPVLPPRPNPGHRLYNKYTLQLPHGIGAFDYTGRSTGELSFQKNEMLLLLDEVNYDAYECQVGDTRGRVQKSLIKVITPLGPVSDTPTAQFSSPASSGRAAAGLKVKAIHDFIPEGPGELGLSAGDVVSEVEQVNSDWYRGTRGGCTGFFPISHVKALSDSPNSIPARKPRPPSAAVSGPRCVARFDFEGENSDELSFSEGDVIQLKAYVGEEWAQGQIGASAGIFPVNFVEVIEDLPPAPSPQQTQPVRIALPGMAAPSSPQPEVAEPSQGCGSSVEWVVALYEFHGQSGDELSFQQGDRILITQHLDAEWSSGRLHGKEGMFPRAFVESTIAARQSLDIQESEAVRGASGRVLYDFASDCDEELSLRVGDIITDMESVDDEWFLGDLRGKRALVPKNYVQILK